MAVRINGAARGGEFISSNLQFYIMYTKIDIQQTGNYQDPTQKDFDSIDLKFIERTDDWGNYSVIHYLFTKGREKTKNILNDYRLVA